MTFYHFQYPNATHMMLIADSTTRPALTDSFEVNPTSGYAYFERSWAIGGQLTSTKYYLDDVLVKELGWQQGNDWVTSQGLLAPTQLTLDSFHKVKIEIIWEHGNPNSASAGLALIYRVP